jgi:hypothetical protein
LDDPAQAIINPSARIDKGGYVCVSSFVYWRREVNACGCVINTNRAGEHCGFEYGRMRFHDLENKFSEFKIPCKLF